MSKSYLWPLPEKWEASGVITRLPKLRPGLPSYSNVASSAAPSHSVSAVLLQPAPPLWTCARKAWTGGRKSWSGKKYLCLLEPSRSFMHTLRKMRTTRIEVNMLTALVLTLRCVVVCVVTASKLQHQYIASPSCLAPHKSAPATGKWGEAKPAFWWTAMISLTIS